MREVSGSLLEKGCYSLLIRVRKKISIQVGRLGEAEFPPGIYLYTGSAMNGLKSRLSRHLRKGNKKSHWHIDYLLRRQEAQIKEILVYPGTDRAECRHNQRIASLPGVRVILKGFGASDCVSGCASHLIYFGKKGLHGVLFVANHRSDTVSIIDAPKRTRHPAGPPRAPRSRCACSLALNAGYQNLRIPADKKRTSVFPTFNKSYQCIRS